MNRTECLARTEWLLRRKLCGLCNGVPEDVALLNDDFIAWLKDLLLGAKRKGAIAMMCHLDNDSHARGW